MLIADHVRCSETVRCLEHHRATHPAAGPGSKTTVQAHLPRLTGGEAKGATAACNTRSANRNPRLPREAAQPDTTLLGSNSATGRLFSTRPAEGGVVFVNGCANAAVAAPWPHRVAAADGLDRCLRSTGQLWRQRWVSKTANGSEQAHVGSRRSHCRPCPALGIPAQLTTNRLKGVRGVRLIPPCRPSPPRAQSRSQSIELVGSGAMAAFAQHLHLPARQLRP